MEWPSFRPGSIVRKEEGATVLCLIILKDESENEQKKKNFSVWGRATISRKGLRELKKGPYTEDRGGEGGFFGKKTA